MTTSGWHALLATTLGIGIAQAAAAQALPFAKAFDDRHEPQYLHVSATYRAGGRVHHLELWRQGQTKLRRATDGVLETYAFRNGADDPDYRMTVLDRRRKITTRIDRINLYRVGNFTDWYDLAHALKYPKQHATVTKLAAGPSGAAPIRRCEWYRLAIEGADRSICWSGEYRIPLLIYAAGGPTPIWQVSAVSTAPVSDATFSIDDAGYVRNDANRDIAND